MLPKTMPSPLGPSVSEPSISKSPLPTSIPCLPSNSKQSTLQLKLATRRTAISALTAFLLSSEAKFKEVPAIGGTLLPGFSFNMVAPEQSFEEAMSEVRDNAESLLGIKPLLASESWEEAQKVLRNSSALLKKDIYTIIQNKPGSERPRLRKLYSDLFNGAIRLDYAARDRDKGRARECYGRITKALDEILSSL
ncbi:hypothetical protein SAY87_005564 [Trapa incisa]|uniref:PsbQ-like protein 3, chloroplastic n=2 Tax=Trapa TaxID=22665 RepID=A0AAN7KZX8_TRANT|nr:hypothetical protein SAY87_005564 [Trapa incisa]KAK4772057.1 hypothetical protein SAY86_013832 [Trapa natans]